MDKKQMYSTMFLRGRSLLYWAILWFKMSNDAFYDMYGFNFNPHEYAGLYEIARKEVLEERRRLNDGGN